MRKFWTLVAAAALVVGCSEDLTSDLNVGPDGSLGTVGEGITLEVSVEDVTRVDIEEGKPAWEVGDCLTLVHDGKSYEYKAVTGGNTASFAAVDAENALETVDASKPVAAFYNVKSVNVEAMTAVFDVAAVQTVGEATNKVPFYTYSATTIVEENKLSLTMKPLASVVEFELTAASAWNADAVSLQSSYSAATYAVASGVAVDATTGVISMAGAKTGDKVTVELGGAVDFATTRNVQMVVLAESFTKTTIEDEEEIVNTYNPVYCDKAVLKLYKGGAENVRISMWGEAAAPSKKAHIYQKVANVLKNKVANGISTVAEFEAFAKSVNESTEAYPTGAEYSNEDGVIVLNSNLTLTAANWIAIGNTGTAISQFGGIFDGNNKTIDGLKVNFNVDDHNILLGGKTKTAQENAGLFGVLANGGAIKNLTVKGQIIVAYADATSWTYAGGVVAQVNGGSVTGCTSKVKIEANEYAAGKTRVGGIVGRAYCTTGDVMIKDCENQGVINLEYAASVAEGSFTPQVAGIVAIVADGDEGYKTTVSYCDNKAAVSATNLPAPMIGGVIGKLSKGDELLSTMTTLTNTADVSVNSNTGSIYIGGIAGYMDYHTLKSSTNSGTITITSSGTSRIYGGGIVGLINNASLTGAEGVVVEKCTNSGAVNAYGPDNTDNTNWQYVGGITGEAQGRTPANGYGALIDECENSGRVSILTGGKYRAGGIVGQVGNNQYVKVRGCTHSGILAVERQTTVSEFYGGIVGNVDATKLLIDNCVTSGTICSLHKTTKEDGKTTSNVFVLLGGILGNSNRKSTDSGEIIISNCTYKGEALSSHDTNNDWDSENGKWVVGNNYQYRAAIVGNIKHANTITVQDCKVGGYVGQVKGGTDTDRYEAAVKHKLVNDVNDTYHFERWRHGYTVSPKYSNITYVDVQ